MKGRGGNPPVSRNGNFFYFWVFGVFSEVFPKTHLEMGRTAHNGSQEIEMGVFRSPHTHTPGRKGHFGDPPGDGRNLEESLPTEIEMVVLLIFFEFFARVWAILTERNTGNRNGHFLIIYFWFFRKSRAEDSKIHPTMGGRGRKARHQ